MDPTNLAAITGQLSLIPAEPPEHVEKCLRILTGAHVIRAVAADPASLHVWGFIDDRTKGGKFDRAWREFFILEVDGRPALMEFDHEALERIVRSGISERPKVHFIREMRLEARPPATKKARC